MMNHLVSLATTSVFAALIAGCGTASVTSEVDTPETESPEAVAPEDPVEAPPATTRAADAPEPACAADSDCVKAECCHAKTCVHESQAPSCEDVMCTMDCRGGTMDCGAGRCRCIEGKCQAEISPRGIPGPASASAPE